MQQNIEVPPQEVVTNDHVRVVLGNLACKWKKERGAVSCRRGAGAHACMHALRTHQSAQQVALGRGNDVLLLLAALLGLDRVAEVVGEVVAGERADHGKALVLRLRVGRASFRRHWERKGVASQR